MTGSCQVIPGYVTSRYVAQLHITSHRVMPLRKILTDLCLLQIIVYSCSQFLPLFPWLHELKTILSFYFYHLKRWHVCWEKPFSFSVAEFNKNSNTHGFFFSLKFTKSVIIEDSPINDVKTWNLENKHKHAKNHNILKSCLHNNIEIPVFVLDHLSSLFQRVCLVSIYGQKYVFCNDPSTISRWVGDYSLNYNCFTKFTIIDLFKCQTKWNIIGLSTYCNLQRTLKKKIRNILRIH